MCRACEQWRLVPSRKSAVRLLPSACRLVVIVALAHYLLLFWICSSGAGEDRARQGYRLLPQRKSSWHERNIAICSHQNALGVPIVCRISGRVH
jgi:hypothetical protein